VWEGREASARSLTGRRTRRQGRPRGPGPPVGGDRRYAAAMTRRGLLSVVVALLVPLATVAATRYVVRRRRARRPVVRPFWPEVPRRSPAETARP